MLYEVITTGFAVVEGGIIKQFKEKPVMNLPMSECLGILIWLFKSFWACR